jgi:hypothetical protein
MSWQLVSSEPTMKRDRPGHGLLLVTLSLMQGNLTNHRSMSPPFQLIMEGQVTFYHSCLALLDRSKALPTLQGREGVIYRWDY